MVNKGQSIAYEFLHSRNTTLDLLLHSRVHFPAQKPVDARLRIRNGGASIRLGGGPPELPVPIPQVGHCVHRLLELINRILQIADAVLNRSSLWASDVSPVAGDFRHGSGAVARGLYGHREGGAAQLQGVGFDGGGVGGESLDAERWIRGGAA